MTEPLDAQSLGWYPSNIPRPDPSTLTDAAIQRSDKAMRDWVEGQFAVRDERLRGIDEATRLRMGPVDLFPTVVDDKVAHLSDVVDEKFAGVQQQFNLNAIALAAALSASEKQVSAALLAQQQATAKQDEANQKAIDKSERATAETIKTNQELTNTQLAAQAKDTAEVKERLTRIESIAVGQVAQKTESRQSNAAVWGAVAGVTGLIAFAILAAGVLISANR